MRYYTGHIANRVQIHVRNADCCALAVLYELKSVWRHAMLV